MQFCQIVNIKFLQKIRHQIQVYLSTTAYNKKLEVPQGTQRLKNFNDLLKFSKKLKEP